MCALQHLSKSAYQERQSRTGFVPSFVRPFRRTGAFILVDGMKGTTAVLLPQGSGDIGFSAAFRRLPMLVQEALAEHGIDDAGILESFPRQSPGLLGMVSAGDEKCSYCRFFYGAWYDSTYGYCWQRGYFFLFFPSSSLSLPLLSCSLSFCVLGVSARIKCSICFCFSRTASHEESGRQDEWSCGVQRIAMIEDFSWDFPRFADFASFSKNSKKSSSSAKASSEYSSELSSHQMAIREKFGGFLRAELSSNGCL